MLVTRGGLRRIWLGCLEPQRIKASPRSRLTDQPHAFFLPKLGKSTATTGALRLWSLPPRPLPASTPSLRPDPLR